MRKIIFILVYLFCFQIHSQTTEYMPISDTYISTEYDMILDTIKSAKGTFYRKRDSFYWAKTSSKDKEIMRNFISEQKKNIKSDTAQTIEIYYFGRKENVQLKINDKLFNPPIKLYKYQYQSVFSEDSIFRIKIGTIPRYLKIENVELLLKDVKRNAKLEFDTNYSLIEIYTEYIHSAAYLIEWKKGSVNFQKKIKESGIVPEAPEKIEIMDTEEVIIYHRIPKR